MKASFSFLSLLALFIPLNIAIAQPSSLPSAKGVMPTGEAGVDYNLLDSNGEKDGVWIRVWPNGSIYYKGTFEGGKPVGSFMYFYDSGKLMSSIEHMPETTAAIHYRPNGTVQASGYYNPAIGNNEPTKQGSWGYYDENSLQIRSESFDDGELEGEYWVKDSKGRLVEKGSYSGGEKDGVWTAFYENGKTRQSITYSTGELEGEFASYHSNNNIRIKGQYLEGHEDGSWKTYLEDGRMEMIIKYSFGNRVKEIRINGTFEDTFPDGRSMSEYSYTDKELDGPYRVWHDCGEYIIEPFTDEETGEQLQRRVLKGTQVKEEGEYAMGKLDGPRYFYDIKGKLVKKEIYENGVIAD